MENLIDRAKAMGLVFSPCPTCKGNLDYRVELRHRLRINCLSCNGIGRDLTPGGVLMAICLVAYFRQIPSGDFLQVAIQDGDPISVSHDGTMVGIAQSALKAWIRAKVASNP